jgi:hypothetical protein
LALIAVGIAAFALTIGPITDIDTYWHVLIGQEILDTQTVTNLGNSWSTFDASWRTTQWLFEVLMAGVQATAGWAGIIWLRTALVLVFLTAYALMLLKRATPAAVLVVFPLSLIPVSYFFQERPLLASLIALIWLSAVAFDLLVAGHAPRWFVIAPLVIVWANLHGMWVLAPALFAVLAIGFVLDRSQDKRSLAFTAAKLSALSLIAGCITPLGLSSLVIAFQFKAATANIAEWQPATVWSTTTMGFLAIIALTLATWIRRREPVPWSQLVFVLALFAFGASAFRNILPATILLAPLAASTLSTLHSLRSRPVSPEEKKSLVVVGVGLISVTLVSGLWLTAQVDPLGKAKPLTIATKLSSINGPKRVLNTYNSSGVLAAFGGKDIKLAIDGRADRNGGPYIDRYIKAEKLEGDWQELLRQVQPNFAVLGKDTALTYELTNYQKWKILLTEQDYVLLQAPAAKTSQPK